MLHITINSNILIADSRELLNLICLIGRRKRYTMTIKKLQKIFYFSTQQKKDLIESILNDEAAINNRYISDLMEQHLLNDLMPSNTKSSWYAQMLYSTPEIKKGNIRYTLNAIFQEFSAFCDFEKIPGNAKEIIDFTHQNFLNAFREDFIDDPDSGAYMISCTESVINRMEYCLEGLQKNDGNNFHEIGLLERDIRDFRAITRGGYETWGRDYTNFIFLCLRDNWQYIANSTYTYRMMAALVNIMPLHDSPEERYKLLQLLKNCTKWDRE